jgi:hypothetical protein
MLAAAAIRIILLSHGNYAMGSMLLPASAHARSSRGVNY